MFKSIIPFYVICVGLYIFFSRQPDYQDGEFTTGIIHFAKDSTGKTVSQVIFSVAKRQYTVAAGYPLRKLQEGQTVKVIYDTSDPSKAAVYYWWGYWAQWDELLASFLIPFILLQAAKAITASPTPEALVEELELRDAPRQKRYD